MAYNPAARSFGPWSFNEPFVAYNGYLLDGHFWPSTEVQGPTFNGVAPTYDRHSTRRRTAAPRALRMLGLPRIFLPPRI